jgi:myo-inositol 2-dehydrogenase/D-chiro-inositol 1-dehydrogenase
MESLVYTEGVAGKHVEHSMHQLSKEEKWGYAQENRAFIDAIIDGVGAAVTVLDGYKSVELVDAVYAALKSEQLNSISNES